MKIKIKYTAQLKKSVGCAEEWINLPDAPTIADALDHLFRKYPGAFTHIVFGESGEFLHAVLLILNGKQVPYSKEILLSDQSQITIMAPIAGG